MKIGFGDEVYYLPTDVRFVGSVNENDECENNECKIDKSERSVAFSLTAPPPLHYAYFSGKYNATFDKNDKVGVKGVRPVYYEDGGNHPPTDPEILLLR